MTRATKAQEETLAKAGITIPIAPPRPAHYQVIVDVMDELAQLEASSVAAEHATREAKYGTPQCGATFRAKRVADAATAQGRKNLADVLVNAHFVDDHIRATSADGERRGEAYGRAEEQKKSARERNEAYDRGVADERKRYAAKGWAS